MVLRVFRGDSEDEYKFIFYKVRLVEMLYIYIGEGLYKKRGLIYKMRMYFSCLIM